MLIENVKQASHVYWCCTDQVNREAQLGYCMLMAAYLSTSFPNQITA